MEQPIRLRGTNGATEGKTWESATLLQAGRLETLEIVLDDSSVSRRHAEIRFTPKGWELRDLGKAVEATFGALEVSCAPFVVDVSLGNRARQHSELMRMVDFALTGMKVMLPNRLKKPSRCTASSQSMK